MLLQRCRARLALPNIISRRTVVVNFDLCALQVDRLRAQQSAALAAGNLGVAGEAEVALQVLLADRVLLGEELAEREAAYQVSGAGVWALLGAKGRCRRSSPLACKLPPGSGGRGS